MDLMTDYAELLSSDPVASSIWTEGSQDPQGLSANDRLAFDDLMLKMWKFIEGQYWTQRLGASCPNLWKSQASAAVSMYRLPGVQRYFSERRMMYSAEFMEFLQTGKLGGEVVPLRRPGSRDSNPDTTPETEIARKQARKVLYES